MVSAGDLLRVHNNIIEYKFRIPCMMTKKKYRKNKPYFPKKWLGPKGKPSVYKFDKHERYTKSRRNDGEILV